MHRPEYERAARKQRAPNRHPEEGSEGGILVCLTRLLQPKSMRTLQQLLHWQDCIRKLVRSEACTTP